MNTWWDESVSRSFKLAFKHTSDESYATNLLQVKQIRLMFHRSTVKWKLKILVEI